ncbi:MAG: leucine-rich repeat domain-containing protein [Firmicutes bacterium]|nr:leucine-rich repeat domain-containing protein [Bacillota bacterium]MBQ9060303.1 leucine-rich repeat domain-containing protein [Bacillota bacterium]
MKKIVALLAVVLVIGACCISASPAFAAGEGSALTPAERTMPRPVDNARAKRIAESYLTRTADGYMRVAYDDPEIVVEYYDDQMDYISGGTLALELPIWGGFYAGTDAYYLVEGQNNEDEDDAAEFIRVIKYDQNWNRIAAASITADPSMFGAQVRYPFDASTVSMTEIGDTLFIATGHEGYVDSNVGQGHQGLLLISVDTGSMTGSIVKSDLYHSFAQFLDQDGNDLYLLELSEGNRRTQLKEYDSRTLERTGYCSVLDYGGKRTDSSAVECYASVNGLAVSDSNVLCVGTSIDQSGYDSVTKETPHNIYLTVTPRDAMTKSATRVVWLTDYTGGGKAFTGLHLTKAGYDRFLVCWEEAESQEAQDGGAALGDPADPLSHWTIHYLFVDGNGQPVTDEFTQRASLADCSPIVAGGKIVYFASSFNTLDFYGIDAKSGAFSKKTHRIGGENISWNFQDGVLSFEGTGEISTKSTAIYKTLLSSTGTGSFYFLSDNSWKYIQPDTTGIIIGEGITSIGRSAFSQFDKLTDLHLPESLVRIDNQAFYRCDALTSVQVPSGVTEFGENVFWSGYVSGLSGKHIYKTRFCAICTAPAIQYAKDCGMSYTAQHMFGTPTYTWSEDSKECKAWAPCIYNPKHGRKEIAKAKAEGDWLVAEFEKAEFENQRKELPEGWEPEPSEDVIDISGKNVLEIYEVYSKVYTGKPQTQKPDIYTETDWLEEGVDYRLTYENNVNVGRAVMIITGIGRYTGTVRKTFKINPKPTSLKSVRKAKRAMTVKWKKQAVQTSGYEIQYSLKKNFRSARIVRIADNRKTAKKIKKLKSKKQYYVRVRTYKTVNGTDFFSKWTTAKKVKVK